MEFYKFKRIISNNNNMMGIDKVNLQEVKSLTKDDVKDFIYGYEKIVDTTWVDLDELVNNIYSAIPDKILINDFYNYVADYCAGKVSFHPDYNKLASTICVDRLHLSTDEDMLDVINTLCETENTVIAKSLVAVVKKFHKKIMNCIDMKKDYLFDYFGIRTLERSYLLKIYDDKKNKIIIERPQHMIMRVALGIHGMNIDAALETYDLISNRYFTHATPTLFNAGTNRPQLSSCFLLGIDDNLDNIFSQLKQMALISKWAGGIGVHITDIRARGSLIRGTNGQSDGILPLCIVLNKISRYVNQGGKRPGSIACFVEPWHADIFDFMDLRKANTGSDDTRAKDLFLASWIPNLFMERVKRKEKWSLMCPDECPGLSNTYGEDFERLYLEYEEKKMYKKQVSARKLFNHLLACQIETGFTYMLYKDHANNKSNQKNLGTIKSSNLCVHGDTLILTNNGNERICDLEDKQVTVWNGFEWSDVVVKKTGRNQNLIRITTSDGNYIDCTPEHKFYTQNDNNIVEVKAESLELCDILIKMDKKPVFDKNNIVSYENVKYHVFVSDKKPSFKNVDTYCFTEHKRHLGVFNGILTGQCAEIIQYSDANTTAVCNLASICLPRFIVETTDGKFYDYAKLMAVTRVIVRNLNKVIDINYYPTDATKESNKKHRPMGIGVQGLADVYNLFGFSYESEEASYINKKIFETIYFAALDESKELAKRHGKYDSFEGSPFSVGKLQYHLWGLSNDDLVTKNDYDWATLVEEIKTYGTRNSLLTALMPTAGTSQLMKCYESFEPYMSNVFVRTTMAGQFIVINENLVRELIKLKLWSDDMRKLIIIKNGSVQDIDGIPEHLKKIYKTAFELSLKSIIGQSADRGPFVDQSQSMNLFMDKPNFKKLAHAHFYGWERGLKTGMYYLRTTPAVNPIQFGIDIIDILRLTKTKSIVELLGSGYNIDPSSLPDDIKMSLPDELKAKLLTDEKEEVKEVKMCKFIPGKIAEGCESCSA